MFGRSRARASSQLFPPRGGTEAAAGSQETTAFSEAENLERVLTLKHKGHPSQRPDFITIFAIVSENFVGGSRQIGGLRPVET